MKGQGQNVLSASTNHNKQRLMGWGHKTNRFPVFLRQAGTKSCNKPPNIVATCRHYSHPSITAAAVLKK
jgi:hypothetical protein